MISLLLNRRSIMKKSNGGEEDSKWIDYYVYCSTAGASRGLYSGTSLSSISRMIYEGNEITPASSMTFEEKGTYHFQILLTDPATIPYNGFNAGHYRNVTLPSCVTSIDDRAFRAYSTSTALVCLATTPPTLTNDPFENCHNLAVYVPDASVSAYEAAWTMMTNIKPLSELT